MVDDATPGAPDEREDSLRKFSRPLSALGCVSIFPALPQNCEVTWLKVYHKFT
jgi:hypothetical protein